MSFLTATNTECIYNMPVNGADVGTASVATIITGNVAANPAAYLPPLYSIWQPSSVVGKGFHIALSGTYDATAVGLTFKYGLNTTQGTAALATVLAQTGSYTLTSTAAGNWQAQMDITVTQSGGSGTPAALLQVNGFFYAAAGNNAATTAIGVLPMGGSSTGAPVTVSVNPTTAYYFEAAVTFAASGVHLYCQQHQIFGLN